MLRYLARRTFSGLIALFIFLTLVFFLTQILVRGDFVNATMTFAPPEAKAAMREQLGLDLSLGERYVHWLGQLARGDLGNSFAGFPVLPGLLEVLPNTLLVLIPAVGMAFLFGSHLGKLTAWRGPGILSDSTTVLAVLLYAFFPPALGFALRYLVTGTTIGGFEGQTNVIAQRFMRDFPNVEPFAVYRQMLWALLGAIAIAVVLSVLARRLTGRPLPVLVVVPLVAGLWVAGWVLFGFDAPAFRLAPLLFIPIVMFTLLTMGDLLIVTRTSVADTIHDQYVMTAWAKGLKDADVRDRHAARNALLPIVSKMVVSLPYLLAGLVIVEVAAPWYGLGFTLFTATDNRDIPLMLGALLLVGLLTLLARLALDVLLALLDPRIRTSTP